MMGGADTDADKAELSAKIENALRTLTTALAGFETSSDKIEQDRAFRKLLNMTAVAGKALFEQPATFLFKWEDNEARGERSLVTFPGLIKIFDGTGQKLEVPKVVMSARVKRI